MANVRLVNRYGVPLLEDESLVSRERAYANSFTGTKPHAHAVAFQRDGGNIYVLTQTRAETKAAWPGKELLFIAGGNANPAENSGDFYKDREGILRIDYRHVASREIKEEVGITVPESDLKLLDSLRLVVSFQALGQVYLKPFYFLYDPEKHGEFKLNKSEVQEVKRRTPSELESLRIPSAFGDYGEKLFEKIKELSHELRNGSKAA